MGKGALAPYPPAIPSGSVGFALLSPSYAPRRGPRDVRCGRARAKRDRGRLASDLPADRILLLVQRALFGAGDVTTVEAGHEPLLVADDAVLGVQPPRLVGRDPAVGDAAV